MYKQKGGYHQGMLLNQLIKIYSQPSKYPIMIANRFSYIDHFNDNNTFIMTLDLRSWYLCINFVFSFLFWNIS